ncbi:hypothetical protein ABPG72_015630 [Tetrahymena utriculariae]
MNAQQIQKKYELQKQKIQELVFQIEKEYKESSQLNYERQKEQEDRENEMERIKHKLQMMKSQHEELQLSANESFLRNSYLHKQIEESESEQQQNMLIIQQMNMKLNYLQDIKKNLENMNNIHSNSLENASLMEQTNEEYKKQMEQNKIKIQKIDTEIQFSKERLEALLKKYQQLKMNEKNIKELQQCLDKEKSKYNRQVQNLSVQNSMLQSQVKEMQSSYCQVKQDAKANKEPQKQRTLAQIAQILTPEDFDRKPKYNQELSEASCKTFHLFQESSFMNKIKVSDFNSNNFPDNESESKSFISLKYAQQPNPQASNLFTTSYKSNFNQSINSLNNSNQQSLSNLNLQSISIQNKQNTSSSNLLNEQNSKDQNQVNKQKDIQKQKLLDSKYLQSQTSQQGHEQSQQHQQLNENGKLQYYQQQTLVKNQISLNSQIQQEANQYCQQNLIQQKQISQQSTQQQSEYLQQKQQIQQQQSFQAQNQYQDLSPKQQAPNKQQIIQQINKNIQRNRAIITYQTDEPQSLNPLQKQESTSKFQNNLQTIYLSQKIHEKPESLEDTPKKVKQFNNSSEVSQRRRCVVSLQGSQENNNRKQGYNNSDVKERKSQATHSRQKSNSIYSSLIIGAGVVAASYVYYKLAPKKQ